MVTLCLDGENKECLVRKYAVVLPMIPPPVLPQRHEPACDTHIREDASHVPIIIIFRSGISADIVLRTWSAKRDVGCNDVTSVARHLSDKER